MSEKKRLLEISLQLLKEREGGVSASQDAVYQLQGCCFSVGTFTCASQSDYTSHSGENILCNGTFSLRTHLHLSD